MRRSGHTHLSPAMVAVVEARRKQKVPITRLAEKTGWSVGAIWNYETGARRVPLGYVEAAAPVLGLKLVVEEV